MKYQTYKLGTSNASDAVLDGSAGYTLFWLGICAAISLALTYVWLINASVHNVVERKHLGDATRTLSLDLAPLETEYLTLVETLTLDRAHEIGLVDISNVTFASADSHKTVVTALGQ